MLSVTETHTITKIHFFSMKVVLLYLTLFSAILSLASGAMQFKRRRPERNDTLQAPVEQLFSVNVSLSRSEINSGIVVSSIEYQLRDPSGTAGNWEPGSIQVPQGTQRNFRTSLTLSFPGSSTAGQWQWRVRATDSNANVKTSGWFALNVESSANDIPIEEATSDIMLLIRANNNRLRPKFVRLGFHDCLGGCDGCIDLTNPDNFGLEEPIDALASVVAAYTREGGLTRADIWAMAAMLAAQDAQPRNRGVSYDFHWYGRATCSATDGKGGPNRSMPSPDFTTSGLLHFFSSEFGFSARETVAIMGAHSIGTLSQENSGFHGPNGWTNNNNILDNRYYSELIGGDRNGEPTTDLTVLLNAPNWNVVEIDNVNNPNVDSAIPNRFQWNKGPAGGGVQDPPIMTNSDIALARDFESNPNHFNQQTGQVTCRFRTQAPNGCPHAIATWDHMIEFKFDDASFLSTFRDVFMKVLHHGTGVEDNVNSCVSPPCLISS